MSIHRNFNKKGGYTQIDNALLDDPNLSYEAIGLLCRLLSKPPTWTVILRYLEKDRVAGREKVARIINELIDAGYVIRRQDKDSGGKFKRWDYDVFEVPQSKKVEAGESGAGFTASGKPVSGSAGSGGPDARKKDESKKDVHKDREKENNPLPPAGESDFSSENAGENGIEVQTSFPGKSSTAQPVTPVVSESVEIPPGRAGKVIDSDSGSRSYPCPEILSPGSLALPETPNTPDWCALIRQYDSEGAEALATIFNDGVSPLTHPQVARLLWKRRQSGLKGIDIEVLVRFYRLARYEGEGAPPWRVNSLSDLLRSSILSGALAASRERAEEELNIVDHFLERGTDVGYILIAMSTLHHLKAKTREDLESFLYDSRNDEEIPVAQGLLYMRLRYGMVLPDIRDRYQDAIRKNLRNKAFIPLAEEFQIDPEEIFGVTREDAALIHDTYWKPFREEAASFRRLLIGGT